MSMQNGNGKQHAVKSALEGGFKQDPSGKFVVDELVPASVLLMFFIQKLGKSSNAQIAERVANAGVIMDPNLLDNAVKALQARGFVSYAKGKAAGSGDVVDMWKARKANFSGTPDVAQVSQSFLSSLVSTPSAEELISALNDSEQEGDGTAKAKEKLKYADYYTCGITFKTRTKDDGAQGTLLGGNPSSSYFDSLVVKGPKCPGEVNMRFPRNSSGQPVIPLSNIRGWLRSGCTRRFNLSPALMEYISISGGLIEYTGKIEQYARQIVDLSGGGGGRGISTYEAIEPGARITFRFTVPARGGPSYQQFITWMTLYAAQSERGLSNARSNEFGFVNVVDAEFLGTMQRAKTALASVSGSMDDEARAFLDKITDQLGDKDLDLISGKLGDVS